MKANIHSRALLAGLVALGLTAAACSSDSKSSTTTAPPISATATSTPASTSSPATVSAASAASTSDTTASSASVTEVSSAATEPGSTEPASTEPATTAAPSSGPVRGFDGKTITVAGLGTLAFYAGADIGAEARFKRFNDTNEIPGIQIKFTEFADDKQDPATALSEVRRLVTQSNVFAIVPDVSSLNPGDYLKQEKVPYVGYALDDTICSDTPSTDLWGFGFNGCLVPADPKVMPDFFGPLYKYVSAKTGNAKPTVAVMGADSQAGKDAVKDYSSVAEGAGFDVVYFKGNVPGVTSDYSPYIQEWMASNGGNPPDLFLSLVPPGQTIPIWQALQAAGYTGDFYTALGPVDALAVPLAGTVTQTNYNTEDNPGLTQMEADLEAFAPGTKPVSYSNTPAYFAADMFIQALKKVAPNITPDTVQQALSNQTWEIKGLVGPTKYPDSTVAPSPNCSSLIAVNKDGSGYTVLEPFTCSTTQYPVDSKFAN